MCNQTTIATPEISEFTLQTPEILYPVKDDSYRLTGETRTGGPTGSPAGYSIAYTYDNVGNRMSQTRNGVATTYAYNTRDQLVSEDSAGVLRTYAYDAAGRMVGKTVAGVTTTYSWEDNDRLVEVSGLGVAIRYVYDHNGQRVKEATAADTVCYLIDYQLPYGQVIAETDGSGNIVASYVYGLDRISMYRGGNTFTYATDGQGSVRQLTNTSGNVTDTYYYTAFGEELAKTGSTVNKFRYVGEQWDANAGWYYNRARWYCPGVGRFTSVDPYAGDPQAPISLHRYMYGNASPINYSDPSGEMSLLDVSTAIAVVGVLAGIVTPYYNSLFKKYVGRTNRFSIEMGFGFGTAPVLFGPYVGFTSAVIREVAPSGNGDPNFEGNSANYLIYSIGLGFGDEITFYSAESKFETNGVRTAKSFAGLGNALCQFQIGALVSYSGVSLMQLPDGSLIDNSFQFSQGADSQLLSLASFITLCIWQLVE